MKIGILTYDQVHNHGAVMQANALRTALTSLGHEVGFLSFNRNYDFIPQEQAKKYRIGLSSIPFYIRYMLQRGLDNILYNIRKNNSLKQYRSLSLPHICRYSDFTGDAVVIGSDEVFSTEIGVNPFLYGHGLKVERVLSYAGCFGPTTMSDIKEQHLSELISSGLGAMHRISVRDENSRVICEALTGRSVTLVCDPVILYGYEKEMNAFVPEEKNYVVVYAYDGRMNDAEDVQQIRAFAERRGLKLYSVGYHHSWCDRNIIASPEELLGWIKHAAFVVTDTFHGSVFSLICQTPMIVKLRDNANKLSFLLREYGLEDRIVQRFSEMDKVADQPVDFEPVTQRMEERREASLQYLREALQ